MKTPDGRDAMLVGITPAGWTPEAEEQRFLAEVERRVGISTKGMLDAMNDSCQHCKDSLADGWLRRILGEKP